MKSELSEQTRNRWLSILPMYGIGGEFLTGKHTACPVCGGKDRFRFDNKEGRGTFYCSNCGAGDGAKLVMLKTGVTFAAFASDVRNRLGETRETAPPRANDMDALRRNADQLWQSAVPIFGDDAARYLEGRGITAPYPASLRFHPAARVTDHPTRSTLPAMLALVRAPDGQPVNVHRTYIENGKKAAMPSPRKMMGGTVPEGSAIRMGAHGGRLGVAEGIETALMVKRRFGITCWSLIDAEKLKRFVIPSDVKELHVFADNDRNYVGQAAAFELGKRASLMLNGPELVRVHVPPIPGTDWADPQPDDMPALGLAA